MIRATITKAKLDEVLDYNPETGEFRWKVSLSNRAKAGTVAGSFNGKGYRKIKINRKNHRAHRLAWLTTTGEFPPDDIDHIDGDRGNNSISNLRAVTHQENQRNQKRHSNNTSGTTGVIWFKSSRKWYSYIKIAGRKKHLGCFDDIADAVAVRKAAEVQYGFHPNHGR